MTTDNNIVVDDDHGRTIKVCKGEEVRRFHFKGNTFEQLKNEIISLYQLSSNFEFILQYQDDEDDRVTLSTDIELTEAFHVTKGIVRFFIVDKASTISPNAPPFYPSSTPHPYPHPHPHPGSYVPPHLRHYGFPPPPPPHHSPFRPHHPYYGHRNYRRGSEDDHATPHHHHHHHHRRGSGDEDSLYDHSYKQWTRKPPAKRYAPFDKEERKREKEEREIEKIEKKAEKAEKKAEKAEKKADKAEKRVGKIEKRAGKEESDEDKKQWKIAKKEIKKKWQQTKESAPQSWHENKKLMIQDLKDLKAEYKTKSAISHGQLIARHVKDVTVPDGSEIAPNTQFIKTWRIRNEGATWPKGCGLVFISRNGDRMGGPERVEVSANGPVENSQEIDVSVPLVSPESPGRYVGFWRLCSPEGKKFGQRVWVSIVVPSDSDSSSSSSSSSSSDGSSSSDDDEPDLRKAMCSIAEMGFDVKKKRIRKMLEEHNGNIDKVVSLLSERMQALNTMDTK
eukprot:TRINITY_DN135_c0_g1_i1.p1 TRINITY_DN135_c0_g1~~TRINITY_DN135_c0_g1_i1.p1  ORF type:complete len:506 (-),score=152.06 TRINITY_DN135_c0_g1_i1:112-1629(-)